MTAEGGAAAVPPAEAMPLPAVYTVPPGVPFVDAVAAALLDPRGPGWAETGAAGAGDPAAADPLALGRITVLLPNRRACRSLREAFLRCSAGRPLLLPALVPVAEPDAEALTIALEDLPGLAGSLDLPPAIPELRRRLLLARLILGRADLDLSADQAVSLAGELAMLIDEVQAAGLGFDRLAGLVPEDFARHWQITLEFLRVVTEHWPRILAEEDVIEPAERRARVLQAQAEAWRRRPPSDPVVAAGALGSTPAIADLLAVVARLPRGAVVLAGLDRELDEASWQALDDTHPQHALRELLGVIGIDRAAVADWPAHLPAPPGSRPGRIRLVREAMRPAATTEAWRGLAGLEPEAFAGMVRVDCPSPREEAETIALMMRRGLEQPGRTVALVTPDRRLARRVATALRRWDVQVDDSGGRSLGDTPVGGFLRLAAAVAAEAAAPVALLALLKHPLAAAGDPPALCRTRARALERAVLRGPRPPPGFAGLVTALARAPADRFDRPGDRAVLIGWAERLAGLAAPLLDRLAGPPAPLAELVEAHVAWAEALAATHDQRGAERLWRRDDGEAAAAWVSELIAAAADFAPVAGRHYRAVFDALIALPVVRPRHGDHPRLFLWGPLEARLQQPDLIILGGLNEGTWPAALPADPWLSRPMRRRFGLPAPERRIGLAAHDVAQALAAPAVALTRSERVEGDPTVPSRWLLRLDAVAAAAGRDLPRLPLPVGKAEPAAGLPPWLDWMRGLDAPEAVRPVVAPAPCPPVAVRPRRLSVTEIGTWMVDPYAIYARHVLGLAALEPLDADPGAAERGQVIHAALAGFLAEFGSGAVGGLPADALDRLLAHGRAAFGELLATPGVAALWWPRFVRVAEWFVATEAARRAGAGTAPIGLEVRGRLTLPGPAGPFDLTARADRIDRLAAGGLALIDYKTGTVPAAVAIAAGLAPQLPLEAAIAEDGGFAGIPAAAVAELAHWRLSGGRPPGEIAAVKPGEVPALVAAARAGLAALIARFDDPATPYLSQPRPGAPPRYSDYAHLARVLEWSAGAGDGGE